MPHAASSPPTDASSTDDLTLRSPRVYALVLGVTLGTLGLSLAGVAALEGAALVVLFAAVALTGIPHGAVDHLVAARLYGLSDGWRDQLRFYGVYLALMAAYGAAWLVAPVACLWAFLVMTLYHFGQADLAYLGLAETRGGSFSARALYLSRGLVLVGLPIAAHPETVAPIFAAIAGADVLAGTPFATAPQATLVALVGQHAVALALVGTLHQPAWRALLREALNTAVLTGLFLVVHPLVAFAVYFGFWHSLGHILELLRFFRSEGEPTTMVGFYRKAALYTVVSFVGLAGLYAGSAALGREGDLVALLFILISMLTLPHMLVVERLYVEWGEV